MVIARNTNGAEMSELNLRCWIETQYLTKTVHFYTMLTIAIRQYPKLHASVITDHS